MIARSNDRLQFKSDVLKAIEENGETKYQEIGHVLNENFMQIPWRHGKIELDLSKPANNLLKQIEFNTKLPAVKADLLEVAPNKYKITMKHPLQEMTGVQTRMIGGSAKFGLS